MTCKDTWVFITVFLCPQKTPSIKCTFSRAYVCPYDSPAADVGRELTFAKYVLIVPTVQPSAWNLLLS